MIKYPGREPMCPSDVRIISSSIYNKHTRRFFKGKQVYLNLFLTIRSKVNPVQYAKQKNFETPISVGSAWQFRLLDLRCAMK